MSGGVDSSVVAAILSRRGYDVVGVTLQIWQESQRDPRHSGCCSLGAVEDARRVARILGIPHYVLNYKDAFRESVIQGFIDEYSAGRTPNPCVECNRKIKFEALMNTLDELGCDRLATGHYARIRRDSRSGYYRLLRARGAEKDQSYVLYMLGQDQLSRTLFPLGDLPDKMATRTLAAQLGLPVASKPDSQEICFVSEAGGYTEFLKKEAPASFSAGEIVDPEGRRIGEHRGLAAFTVGQRRGIGLTARDGRPLYVLRLEPSANRVVVGHDEDLLQSDVVFGDAVWAAGYERIGRVRIKAKIRYTMPPQAATLFGGAYPRLVFDEAVRAVTPGQIAVAYRGSTVVAGGVIQSTGV